MRLFGPIAATVHPCAKAAKALEGAGYRYELGTGGWLSVLALDLGQPEC